MLRLSRRLRLAMAVLLALAAVACHTKQLKPASDLEALSPTLIPFVHYEEGKLLFIGVDGRAASFVKDETIVPLGIGLANVSMTPLTVSRESFVLEDEQGRRYPVVSYKEFKESYTRSRTDERLAEPFIEALSTRYIQFNFMPFRIFPAAGSTGTVQNVIELGRRQYTRGYLYFPMPEGGIHGKRFTLLVDAKEVPDTFLVRFELR